MSTPDRTGLPGGLPGEVRLLEGQAPLPNATPAIPTSTVTPGVAGAGARVPGAPTLPDWDPISLSMAVQRAANELFGAQPGGVSPEGPFTATSPVPSPSPILSPSPSPVPPPSPSPVPSPSPSPILSPFHSDPSFAALPSFGVPSLDAEHAVSALRFPLIDLSTPAVDEPAPAAPPATIPTSHVYQIEPVSDLALRPTSGAFDAHLIRREFPILEERVHGKRLVWLDNAATTQKPQSVIDRISTFYERENSNIHRAAHTLAARASDAYEQARETTRRFLNAPSVRDIVFVRGATEGINLVAKSWGHRNVQAGDEIVITWLEHHANIVPWQMLCAEKGARLRVAPVDETGQIILDEYEKLLGPKTRIVALPQVSNALGTVTPAKEMVEIAHRYGAKVLVDGAQAVSHMRADVQALDCDFYVFSGHKVFAPTGIGVVYARSQILDETPPWQGGGNMIQDVTFERTVYQPAPARFEAGTGNIADAVGLGAALDWLTRVGVENVGRYEHELLEYATAQLATVPGLTMIGTAPGKAGVLSFILAGQKTEEVGGLLDKEGIAVRSGHHCAQPILRRFGVEATVRASLAPYNLCEDIDALVSALHRLQAGRGGLR